MNDIVERLRAYVLDDHERGCQGRYYDCSCGYDGKRGPLMGEAAAEIERLRAGLFDCMQEAANHHRENQARAEIGGSDMAQRKAKAIVTRSGVLLHNINTIARTALEGKR